MARKFFYVCAGMFLLALSYHFGASTATAQAGSQIVGTMVGGSGDMVVMTSNGDAFYMRSTTGSWSNGVMDPIQLRPLGNFWAGSPTPALHESWGQVKARYRGNPVSTTPGTPDR